MSSARAVSTKVARMERPFSRLRWTFVVRDVFENHGHLFPSVTSNWFADDGVASGPLPEVKEFISILSRELQLKAGLEVKFVTCLGGVETDEVSLLEPVEGLNWKNIRWSPGDNECGITAAGTPVGTAEYVRKEALAIAEKHQDRLDRIADFAEHGEDGPRDFGKDFTTVGTRHLGLTLLDYCCKHRFDYVTHLSSKEILGEGLIEHVQRSIHSCFSRICDGEIQVPLLDEVGKQLLALPLRYGGQAIHDIGFEADISLVSTLHALSPGIVRRLSELHRKKFISAVQQTAGSASSFDIFADKTFSWLQAMVNACKRTNSLLRTLQVVGLTADPNTVLVAKSSLKWKKGVLRHAYDQKAMVFEQKLEEHARKEKLRGNHVPSVLLKLYRCNLESGNVWRDYRAVAFSQQHLDGEKLKAPNLIRDSSLAPIIRWKLLQPLVGGPGVSDLPPDELFGWAVLLDPKRPGPPGAKLAGPSKKHRHNDVVKIIGRIGAAATRQSLVTEHSRAMDVWKLADPEATADIHHSPDFALVDAQGRATLFDFTQPRPITRVNGRMVNYCDLEQGAYLKVAEKKKRESHWRFVRHQFAGLATFMPLAMDWDGAFGDTFTQVLEDWANSEVDRCTGVARLRLDDKPNIRQQMVTSKIRDYAAQIQTHNLDLIGQALHFARHAVAVTGKAARNNRRLETHWEEVAVQAICPPPTGGFHLFDGERDPAVPMDSPVTASAAVLVPRQVTGVLPEIREVQ